MRIGIVGGGLSGLAAGVVLVDAGFDVELFERSRLLGGRATSFEIDGVEVDNGQHVFLGCCTEFIDLVRRVGLVEKLYLQERFDALVVARDGSRARLRAAALPAPWHLLASFLRYRHLGLRAKIDVGRALTSASRDGDIRERTFAQWLARHHQSAQAIAAFWEPFFVPALNEPLDRMDAREALFTLRTAFLGDPGAARFGYSRVPLAHIAEAAAQRFTRVHRSTSVATLDMSSKESAKLCHPKNISGVRLITTSGERHEFDAIVLALTPPQLHRLLNDPTRYGIPSLDGYRANPIIDVHLRYTTPEPSAEKDARLRRAALKLSSRAQARSAELSACHPERSAEGAESREALLTKARTKHNEPFDFAALIGSPVQWIFQKGEGYICCSMSAAEEYVRRSTDELIALAWSDVQKALPFLREAKLLSGAVTRNPEATFTASPETVRPGPATSFPNLAIAGSWTNTGWPDTMESAVRSGIAAAHHIQEDC